MGLDLVLHRGHFSARIFIVEGTDRELTSIISIPSPQHVVLICTRQSELETFFCGTIRKVISLM